MSNLKLKNALVATVLGLLFYHWQVIQIFGQTNSPSSSDGTGSAKAQASASLPSVSLGNSNSGGTPSGLPEPSTGLDGVSWDGKSFKVTDIKIIDSKFSAYLNEPEISYEEEKEYAEVIEKTIELLDVFSIREKNRNYLIKEVLPLLRKASRHKRDGGLCRSIYNAIGTDLQAKDASFSKKERMKELEKKVDSIKWNMRMATQASTLAPEGSRLMADDETQRSVKFAFLNDELQNTYAEMQAITKEDLEKIGDSRIALQRIVVGFFLSRRFDHVMIGAPIYRLMYSDGAGEVKLQQRLIQEAAENAKQLRAATSVATSESSKTVRSPNYRADEKSSTRAETGITSMLPGTTAVMDSVTSAKVQIAAVIPDTMTEIEMISQEAIDQCNRYLSAVNGHLAQSELDNAYQRLQEAFSAGENLACVRSFPRDSKQALWKYKKAVKEARAGLASKDLGKAKSAMDQLGQMTTDNPFSKEESEMGNIKTISAMHLAKAKEAAIRGDRETMNKELEEAAKIWPQNPALAESSAKMLDQLNQQVQGKEDLKKLLEQKNFKYIMDEKAKFLAVAADDPALLEKLKNVLEQQGKALSWKARVEELLKRNDPYGAWEEAEKGIIDHPESNDLMKLRSDAAVKCPEFVDKIEKARIATVRQDPAAALAAYLVARQIYPQSTLAREGIDSLSKQLLAK